MKEIKTLVYSPYEPVQKNSLWIKPSLSNNTNKLYIYNNGWEPINVGGSETGASDYNELENLPSINNVILKGNKSLNDLGIVIPDVSGLATKEEVKLKADQSYVDTQIQTRPTSLQVDTWIDEKIADQEFKTINGQNITGTGNIQIEGSSIEVDDSLSETSVNPVENKVITEKINQLEELLQKLDDKVFPTTFSVSGGGTFDEGTTQVITVTWRLQKDNQTITPDSVTVNGESVDPSVNYKVFANVTSTTTYTVRAVYNGKTYTGSTTATFKKTYYRYYGAMPLSVELTNITDSDIKALKKEVCTGAAASNLSFPIPEEGRLTYAYPSRFGNLTQVQDVNAGNAPSTDWSTDGTSTTPNPRTTLTIDGESYYVYCSINPNYEGTFKLNFVK